jgi:uncharacterized protein YqhQ
MANKKKTSIGGQALIEGIMMRGPVLTSMATRMPDGSIDVETWNTHKGSKTPWTRRAPFIRGIFNMVDSMVVGYHCLMKSAEKAGVEEEPTKFDKWLEKKLGHNMMKMLGGFAAVLGVALAAVLFIFIPTGLSSLLKPLIGTGVGLSLIEGLIKVIILVGYMWLCSRMKDMRRVFEYHGAEHKSVACYEAGLPLTVENVRPQRRLHPRCGTSFLFLVVFISIIIGSFISWDNPAIRMLLKLLLIPVVVGISYELIKLAGRSDGIFTRIISAPGMWLQHITTCEPDDGQIECAIAALTAVIPEDENADRW